MSPVGSALSIEGTDPVVMDGDWNVASSAGFLVMGMAYDDAEGTDVRLYAISPSELVPMTDEASLYLTLGTGRGGARGTLSSMAMTSYFGTDEVDVVEVTVAETSGGEAAYLSAARFCRHAL